MERRKGPRADITLNCTLTRPGGTIASALTVDLSPTGARVMTAGALRLDEFVEVEFPAAGTTARLGRARVAREHAARVYAIHFEQLTEPARRWLGNTATG